jgi:hypothetical protein
MAKYIKTTMININDIKEVPLYKSIISFNNQYDEIKKSIMQIGFIFPVTVNHKYELLDGYSRLKIARELGITEIPVEIYETNSIEEELDMIASLNLKRRHLSKDEIIMFIDKIHETKQNILNHPTQNNTNPRFTNTLKITESTESRYIKQELKKLIPDIEINEETIRRYLQIKNNAPWLLQFISNEKIGIKTAHEIYRRLKSLNLLDLYKLVNKDLLNKLILTKSGRQIIMNDEEILRKLINNEIDFGYAVIIVKRKLQRKNNIVENNNRQEGTKEEDIASEQKSVNSEITETQSINLSQNSTLIISNNEVIIISDTIISDEIRKLLKNTQSINLSQNSTLIISNNEVIIISDTIISDEIRKLLKNTSKNQTLIPSSFQH